MDKLVSIIIPTCGRPRLLNTAIESAMQQSYQNIEIIVVDDNAKDSPERILTEKIMQKYEAVDQVKYYKHIDNQGVSAARNTGIINSMGEYITFLDDDDRYLPEYVEKMFRRIVETNSDMVYMPRAYCDDGKRIYTSKIHQDNYPEGYIFKEVLSGRCPIGIFFIAKKVTLKKIGMFDLGLKGFEDGDIWFGISKIGKVSAMDGIEAVYSRDEQERLTKNPYKWEENLKIFEEKWQKKLTEEEKSLFQRFVDFHKNQNECNKIFWELSGNKSGNISLKKYLKMDIPWSMKVKLILVRYLGDKGERIYNWLRLCLCKRRFLFLEEEMHERFN